MRLQICELLVLWCLSAVCCSDINECEVSNPCISPAECVNGVESYHCECPVGYRLNPDSVSCNNSTLVCKSLVCTLRDGCREGLEYCEDIMEEGVFPENIRCQTTFLLSPDGNCLEPRLSGCIYGLEFNPPCTIGHCNPVQIKSDPSVYHCCCQGDLCNSNYTLCRNTSTNVPTLTSPTTISAPTPSPSPATETPTTETPPTTTLSTEPVLSLICTATGNTKVTIDCVTSQRVTQTFCSFDGRVRHQCELPMIITRQVFSAGHHHVTVVATDARGVSAEARVDYVLPDQNRNRAEPADVPPLYLEFVSDTPRIAGRTIEAEFVLSRPATSVTCSVRGLPRQECASGSVRFTNLPVRGNMLVVSANNGGGDRVIERVSFVIADEMTCSVHLINRGLTLEEGSTTVEFTGIGQFTSISCSIDGASYQTCESPAEFTNVGPGQHRLKIKPQGCVGTSRVLALDFSVQ